MVVSFNSGTSGSWKPRCDASLVPTQTNKAQMEIFSLHRTALSPSWFPSDNWTCSQETNNVSWLLALSLTLSNWPICNFRHCATVAAVTLSYVNWRYLASCHLHYPHSCWRDDKRFVGYRLYFKQVWRTQRTAPVWLGEDQMLRKICWVKLASRWVFVLYEVSLVSSR